MNAGEFAAYSCVIRSIVSSEIPVISLTRDGRLVDRASLDRVRAGLAGVTDCFLFCHGWLYDEAEARQEGERFFALLEKALAPW